MDFVGYSLGAEGDCKIRSRVWEARVASGYYSDITRKDVYSILKYSINWRTAPAFLTLRERLKVL